MKVLPNIALLIAAVLAVACSNMPKSTAIYRQDFSAGEAGWQQFRDLADLDHSDIGDVYSVKFFITNVKTAPQIYFIPSTYALHQDFAVALDPTNFPTTNEFQNATYFDPLHPHAAGTLLWYPNSTFKSKELPDKVTGPLSMQFFPSDDLPFDLVMQTWLVVLPKLAMLPASGQQNRLMYTPANDHQQALALEHAQERKDKGVLMLTRTEVFADLKQQSMNVGVAFGTLKLATSQQLVAGSTSFQDIMILPQLPLGLPPLAGTISEELQTPLAHVNIAAKTRGTPNLALLDARHDPRVAPLIGKAVRFEVMVGGFSLRAATSQEVLEFWKEKLAGVPLVPKADLSVVGVTDLENVFFESSIAFGVKASNYAELHHLWQQPQLKADILAVTGGQQDSWTPPGLAVPFSAYEAHILAAQVTATDCAAMAASCQKDGTFDVAACDHAKAACDELVGQKLANLKLFIATALQRPDFQTDSALRAAMLFYFRWKIEHQPIDAKFGAEIDLAIKNKFCKKFQIGSLVKYTCDRDVRLRSSTNAEDLDGFTGAGLYDSFSATPDGLKPPSSRIRKTWGSVWSWRAFEERTFWRISHMDVRMAVLIHQSYPNEACNGVIITKNLANPTSWGFYVNLQKGEESVTNPVGDITPEVFSLLWTGDWAVDPLHLKPVINRLRFSSLSPGVALMSLQETGELLMALYAAHQHFAKKYDKDTDKIAFDAEIKVHNDADGQRRFYVKQIRPY